MTRGLARVALALLAGALLTGAAAKGSVRVDNWEALKLGPVDLSVWRVYPFTDSGKWKDAPDIVMEDGRRALRLRTANEALRIGRALKIDLKATPWLAWEWKALDLPSKADVRDPKRNDQAARIMVGHRRAETHVWTCAIHGDISNRRNARPHWADDRQCVGRCVAAGSNCGRRRP